MEGPADLRIVMLGKTGAGKSSSGNSILGEKLFKTSCSANSHTSTCKAEARMVNGRKITVIDTPGFVSTDCSDESLKAEAISCMIECAPGPHAFLIVLSVGRHTVQEEKAVEEILKMFGEKALKYAIVLFTHGDQLENGMTIQQFVDENAHLKTLAQKCGDRVHVIDNKYWNNPTDGCDDSKNTVQIKKLMNTIYEMEKLNRMYYICELLQAVGDNIEKRIATMTEETKGQLSETKMREMAKGSTMKMLLKQTVGITTGALLGVFLGALWTVKIQKKILSDDGEGRTYAIAAAVSGGIIGGAIGAQKAEEAETVGDAASKSTNALIGLSAKAKFVIDTLEDTLK